MKIKAFEQAEIELVPAGIASRAVAYVMDFIVRWLCLLLGILLLLLVFLVFDLASVVPQNIVQLIRPFDLSEFNWLYAGTLLIIFIVELLYSAVFEAYFDGQTPGKLALGMRVRDDRGLPITFRAALLRSFFRFVDIIPILGAGSILLTKYSQRLGDLAARTIVTFDPSNLPIPELTQTSLLQLPPLPKEEYVLLEEYFARRHSLLPGPAAHLPAKLCAALAPFLSHAQPHNLTREQQEQLLWHAFKSHPAR